MTREERFEALNREVATGNAKAMYDLALYFYLENIDDKDKNRISYRDEPAAFKYFNQAAMSNLGREYCDEITYYKNKLDDDEYFKKADEAGTIDSVVVYLLGKFYEGYYEIDVTSDSIEEDRKQSLLYHRRACALGNPDASEALEGLKYEEDFGDTTITAEVETLVKEEINNYDKIARLILTYFNYKALTKIQKGENFSYVDHFHGIRNLNLVKGDKIIISAKGDEAKEAVAAIKELIDSNFGEE